MRLAKKVLSIVLMISMLLGNFFLPVSFAVAATNDNDSIVLLSRGSVWEYLDDGSDQGTAWRDTSFDDSSWQSGAAPLGYPSSETNSLNGRINTVISYGSDSSHKYPTSYFRTTFNVDDLSAIGDSGSILAGIDDAAVIYLNGHEVSRTNLPSKADLPEIGYDKYVSDLGQALDTATEGASPVFTLDATDMSYLVQGENVLSAEVHQGRADSSDVYWDMELVANTNPGSSTGDDQGSGGAGGGGSNGNGYVATDLTFAPGRNATELNFAWYSNDVSTSSAIQVAKKADMTGTEFPASSATTYTATTTSAITGYISNKVTVTNLQESTAYVYRVGDDNAGTWSPVYNFTTHATDSFSFLAVGDPQIGASGSVNSDTTGWKDTMSKALSQFPDVSFLASLGDQINSNSNEDQYNGYFAPSEFRSLPIASLVGNHDNGAPNYSYHFNPPNLSSYGATNPGSSDYYFTYGNTLFIVLNTNNSSAAEHDTFMEQAINATPNAKWKVVMFHQDIYGSANHSTETGIVNLRQALFPVFDNDGIDLVLDGHDHSYTRTYQMLGDEVQATQTDAEGAVLNPTGTVYITLNSGSGSKYYDLKSTPETYAAVREQINVPTFSKISETDNSLSITTYRTDTMAVTDTYTIKKGTSDNEDENTYKASDLTFAPGQNATELNFAWYSTVDSQNNTAVQVAKKEDMTDSEFPEDKATTYTGTVSSAVTGFFSNKVIVTNLEEATEYVYRVGDASSGSWSPVYNFKTHSTDSFSFFAVGDPQIGAGGSVASDTNGWKTTMSKAVAKFPEVGFLASLGDQINDKTDESEYTGFFAPPELRSLPVSTLIGNHENGAPNYSYHFNPPNLSSQYGITTNTSSDYYFTYGDTLFMVLNTNNPSGAEHDAFMQEAIDATPNAKWKVVMFHQDIYGSADHSMESSILNLRQALFPVFDRDKIDLVLDGHDHSYTRTYQMLGDQALPGQTVDADGAVVNPIGTLYMTLNSGSGSKYYDLKPAPETYAALREQLRVPTFSNITVTSDTLSISTYRTDTMAVTDTYTIKKVGSQQALDISQLAISADGDILATEDPSSNVKLNLAAKDSQNADVDLTGAYVLYQTDKPDTLSIAADGTVTVKNKPDLDTTAKVWAEVYNGSNFVKSNELDLNVTNPYGLALVTLDSSSDALDTETAGASVNLSLNGKDTHNADVDLSSATVTYTTDQEGILNIASDGTVTLQNKPDHNVIVNITAEVTLNGITVISNKFLLTVGAKGIGTEIVAPIKNALDDMEERPDGSLDYDSSDLEITMEKPTSSDVKNQLIGLRFADLSIPKGVTITNAYIQFSVDETDNAYNPFDVNIYAEDVANSAALQNVPYTVSTRVKTSDAVEWKITGTDDDSMWKTEHAAGPAQQTPNLASLVQDIVDKDGWNAGNALSFLLSGEGKRTAESFEGASGNSDQIPTLHVSFVTTDSISDARSQGAGTTPVTVSGVVTCVNPTSSGSYFIQDGTAGINVFNTSLSPAPQQGDRILVTGPMILFNGLLEIKPANAEDVHILSSGNSLPAPAVITIDQLGDYQSQLIKIRNVTLGNLNPSGTTTITDTAGHSTVIYQMGTPLGISVGDQVNITAIASSYNNPELILRNDAEIVKAGSILAARDDGAGQTATVTGIVTSVNPTTNGSYFIQDGTAGICVYDTTLSPAPQQGDQIQITGPMALYHGLLEIASATAADYHVLSNHNPIPDPVVVTIDQLGNYQSQLVKVQNVTLGTINNSGNTTITDDSGQSSILFKMPSVSGINEGDQVDITAVVAAYNTSELIARDAADIVMSSGTDDSGVSNVEILATSDLHGTVYPYDYFSGATVSEGLAKVSTYVNQERAIDPNLLLVDNGDTIQGTPLATYYATIDKTSPNPMISAMAAMHYDTWTLGNHEFNFGLDMLNKVINEAKDSDIHVLSANTYKGDDTNLADPYYIKTISTENGDIKVGILGLTTKCIPNWESPENYQDLHFNDLVDEANKWVPIMREAGADVIVATIHSGEESSSDIIPENQIKAIAQGVNGIDAIVAGHTHAVIQQHSYTSPDGKTVLVTEPGKWGQYVSKLQFSVKFQDGKWSVVNKSTQAVAMDSSIAPDSTITSLVQPNQDATLAYLGTKIGTATDVYSGADQLTAETAIMDLINKVQQQESGAQLSIAAPLSSSALIPQGDVTIKDISSVYVYENFLYSINMTGAQLKKWLEFSARYYKQVSGSSDSITKDPALNIPDYNLDQLYGANYTIDLTQSAGSRIKNLTYNGNPINDTDVFTVAINNYRYNGGGGFMDAAGLISGQGAIYDSMKTLGDAGQVRNLLIKYVQDQGTITPTVADNWSIVKEAEAGSVPLGIDLEKSIVEVGGDANITLSAKAANDLYGFDLRFKYDPAMFTFEGVTPNPEFDLGDTGVTHDADGNIHVIGVLQGKSAGVNGDIDLVTIKLKANGEVGSSNLALLNGSELSNSSSELTVLEQDVQDTIAIANSDVTGNGKTEINDLVMVAKQFGAQQSVTGSGYQATLDMNKDGVIDIVDIVYMAQKLLGK
ncbi:metallophosphoesterase [Desulfosporosinus sp. OT]|uniref:metallophosphoesterase n=1 Tax=Desulfosporosinus sp. OT TaxID=913865 RepID=UPI0002239E68|nr:metallophosphoesterase [Desulfosporosinus sp. OT]EGW38669.1 calcineurin-like phosphoesterase family protein [Desulfosporosinus sp. OT]